MLFEKEIKLIIIDFDGVILESENAKNEAFEECFSIFPEHFDLFMEYHRKNKTRIRYEKFKYFYENILQEEYTSQEKDWISNRFNEIVFQKVINSSYVPGAYDFIKTYSRIVPIWIVTGTPKKELKKVIHHIKIEKYFEKIFSIPPPKSQLLRNILYVSGYKSNQVVYIGDMQNDLEAAKKNNIPFIARKTNDVFSGPLIGEINDFKKIDKILINKENRIWLTNIVVSDRNEKH